MHGVSKELAFRIDYSFATDETANRKCAKTFCLRNLQD